MTFWTYDHLAQVTGGTWRVPPREGGAIVPAAERALSTDESFRGPILWHDTRELQPGQIYLAIKGDNFDGHDFIDDAFNKGAALAIVNAGALPQSSIRNPQSSVLEVPDTIKALQDLARAYRDELTSGGCKVIGVAGSNGKTTTRHLIHHVLTHADKVGTQSPKSFNNHLGVPLTLLAALPGDDFVACEIGTNHPGEIDFLSAIARPDIAVITSIGEEHLEFFKDLDGVSKEESAIASYLKDGGDLILGLGVATHVASHLNWAAAPNAILLDRYEDESLPEYKTNQGPHFWKNALIAASVAESMNIQLSTVKHALQQYEAVSGRMEMFYFGQDVTVIHDAYNANPTSMSDMVEWFLSGTQPRRRVLVVGDMLELGDAAQEAHEALGEQIDIEGNRFFTVGVGPLCGRYLSIRADNLPFPQLLLNDMDEKSSQRLAAQLQPGDTVLLKASRGMRLERLIPAIEKRFGKVESPQPVKET